MTAPRVAIPALPLQRRLARQRARIGALAAIGDWSQPAFRHFVTPVLVAAVRRIDGLPAPGQPVADSGSRWLLAQALAAVRSGGLVSSRDPQPVAGRQLRDLVVALAAGCARIHRCWIAVDERGESLGPAAQPLSVRVSRLDLPIYYAVAAAEVPVAGADHAAAALGWLLHDLPAGVLVPLVGVQGDHLPRLMARVRESTPDEAVVPGVEAEAMATLVRDGTWQVNRRKGRLWWINRRLYLAWRTGARELARRCAPPAGAPLAPAALLDRLNRCGLARDREQSITTPWTPALEAVELTDPAHWLAIASCVDHPGVLRSTAAPCAG